MNPVFSADAPYYILIVEDEPKLAALLKDYLQRAGYDTAVLHDGTQVLPSVQARLPDLILLDLMLPGMSGLEICRALRRVSDVPIMMVTARVEEIDRLLGLEVGADDYLCKPFSPREVVARVGAILRRAGQWQGISPSNPAATSRAMLVVDAARHEIHLAGHLLDLTPVEFRLLNTLQAQPGRVFSREQLMNCVYEDYRVVTDRTVDSHIKNLRRKLEQACPHHEMIQSIYGVGYKFVG